MAAAVAGAALSAVLKALSPVTDTVLEAWAASKDLGPNVNALKLELLCVKAVLEPNLGRERHNSALEELLWNLQDLAYKAEDVLDELDYFRIQDELYGTIDAVDKHPKGCTHNLVFNATHTAKAVGKLIWSPACCSSATAAPGAKLRANGGEVNGCMRKLVSGPRNTIRAVGKCLPCSSLPPVRDDDDGNDDEDDSDGGGNVTETIKLEFNRVDVSKRIEDILKQLQPLYQKICTVLQTLGSNQSTVKHSRPRPATISESIESKLYGRDHIMNNITNDITQGKYCDEDLTVIPIVGPGGIGKTTLAQHIYHKQEVQKHFQVKVWVCVSVGFNVDKLTKEIEKHIPTVADEKKGTSREVIEQRLKSKRFLLILDDIWKDCNDEEWKTVLLPLKKSQVKGNIVIITTRFPGLAKTVKTVKDPIELEGLNNEEFKELFLAFIFDDEQSRKDHKFLLLQSGDKIVGRLKGSPLAAKTVGRLLRNHLNLDHWNRVLESREWESENGQHDIMPALKLSYDYLPFHLQQCFSYCALFPEDYKFKTDELIHLWIGLDVLHPHGKNKRTEDIGLDNLTELVSYGFFRKEGGGEHDCYVVHDLLHELALKVSSQECLSICSYNVRSTQIRPSIHHLSIIIDDTSVKDRMTFDACKKDLSALVERLKIENLHSLMLFGRHQHNFVKTLAGLLNEAKSLRVLFLSEGSYKVEDLLHNFSSCLHLRYLRFLGNRRTIRQPNIISRFYHLRVLDQQERHLPYYSSRDMSNLVKLRHFLVPSSSCIDMHSRIFEVGKLKSLQELRSFAVKQESQGFELSQIGHLVQLCGSLGIYNLGKVEANEEAEEAKLNEKTHLQRLTLCWDSDGPTKKSAREEQVLERLKPSDNLIELCIRGHGGAICPSWLGADLSVKNLEFLRLDDVAWKNLPPLGELWLINEHGDECRSSIPGQSFNNLKKLELVKIPKLKKWIRSGPHKLFSELKLLIVKDCPELMELPFTRRTGCEPEHHDDVACFPKLEELNIADCPKLSSLPCIPWCGTMYSAKITQVGSGLEYLDYGKNYEAECCLEIKGKDAVDSTFWMAVAFPNLSELRELEVTRCPPLSLDHLQMLSSLKTLKICDSRTAVRLSEDDDCVGYQFPVEQVTVKQCGDSGERLTRLLSYFPKLRSFSVIRCEKLTGLGVVNNQQEETEAHTQPPSSSINKANEAQIEQCEQQEIAAATSEGLLLLPPQLQELHIWECQNLVLWSPGLLDNDEDAGRTAGGGGGVQGLRSLRTLSIYNCPRFLSAYSSSSPPPCFLFPVSLVDLYLLGVLGTEMPLPLSNLTSLANLSIGECGDLRANGLRPLLTQGRLTKLSVRRTPNFIACSESSLPREQESPSSSSKLHELETDDIAGALAAPIWTLLSSSLTDLCFSEDKQMVRFTDEHEEALRFLTTLERIKFSFCDKLQSLPAGLHRLPNLKRLYIRDCAAIGSLPKNGLPSSLQKLEISYCRAIQSLTKECLPSSLQTLKIEMCPAIRSLPKVDDLPSSLRELDVRDFRNSEELRRQCCKLIGTIPIVYA